MQNLTLHKNSSNLIKWWEKNKHGVKSISVQNWEGQNKTWWKQILLTYSKHINKTREKWIEKRMVETGKPMKWHDE